MNDTSIRSTFSQLNEEDKELLNKYIECKNQRKKAEEGAQLIQNRINLLLQEEIKANKQIHDTRKKIQEVLNQKLNRQFTKAQNENIQVEKIREQMKQLEISKARKMQTQNQTIINKEKFQMKKKQDVSQLKENMQLMKSEKENRDIENYTKNRQNVHLIKEQERMQKIAKVAQRKEREILNKISQNTRNKEENSRYTSKEEKTLNLEGFEYKLFQKLKRNEPFGLSDDVNNY